MIGPNAQLARIAEVEVFAVDGEPFTWADAVLGAHAVGEWELLRARTRAGLAALRRLTAAGGELSHAETVDAAKRFRYERELLAVDELNAWLVHWGLSVADWRDYLRRDLLRARATSSHDGWVPNDDVDAAIGAEAICSGWLESAARRLASQAALARPDLVAAEPPATHDAEGLAELLGMSAETCAGRLGHLGRLAAAASAARAELVGEPAVEHELAEHRLDWLRFDVDLIDLRTEDAAREAILCVRTDGVALPKIAAEAGTSVERRSLLLADAPDWLAPYLFGVEPGSLVGPVAHADRFAVISVAEKHEPTVDDPEARQRAEAALVERAARQQRARRVSWHERL